MVKGKKKEEKKKEEKKGKKQKKGREEENKRRKKGKFSRRGGPLNLNKSEERLWEDLFVSTTTGTGIVERSSAR